jgi:hypothetical protein
LKPGCRHRGSSSANKDWWKKDAYARRWRRCIDDPWRGIINSFTVAIIAIRPINRPVVAISMPSFLVTAAVMSIVSSEGRRHVYAADHCG